MMAAANNSNTTAIALRHAQLGLTRYMEQNFPAMFKAANPDFGTGGPYRNYNPYTDKYLQNPPPDPRYSQQETQ